MRIPALFVALLALLATPAVARAQSLGSGGDFLMRVGGPLVVASGETVDTAVGIGQRRPDRRRRPQRPLHRQRHGPRQRHGRRRHSGGEWQPFARAVGERARHRADEQHARGRPGGSRQRASPAQRRRRFPRHRPRLFVSLVGRQHDLPDSGRARRGGARAGAGALRRPHADRRHRRNRGRGAHLLDRVADRGRRDLADRHRHSDRPRHPPRPAADFVGRRVRRHGAAARR